MRRAMEEATSPYHNDKNNFIGNYYEIKQPKSVGKSGAVAIQPNSYLMVRLTGASAYQILREGEGSELK